MERAPAVRLTGVMRRFGPVEAVKPLDLEIAAGDFLAILGPSGCGKTTLLRMIGGFVEPSAGRIEVAGRDVTRLGPEARPTNMVFQSYGLFPHMSVAQNVAYGLRLRRRPRQEVARRVAEALALVRLEGFGERPVAALSGGQQQRVALARALVMEPAVLLLDEPLAALDLKLRQAMQEELRRIHRSVGGTFVFVTHDQGEALALANRIAVMSEGRLEQLGSPEEIYQRPASRFVATFIGEANLLAGERRGGRVQLAAGPAFEAAGGDGAVVAVVRPESLQLGGGDRHVDGVVEELVFLGTHLKVTLRLGGGEMLILQTPASGLRPAVGERLTAGWPTGAERILEAQAQT